MSRSHLAGIKWRPSTVGHTGEVLESGFVATGHTVEVPIGWSPTVGLAVGSVSGIGRIAEAVIGRLSTVGHAVEGGSPGFSKRSYCRSVHMAVGSSRSYWVQQ